MKSNHTVTLMKLFGLALLALALSAGLASAQEYTGKFTLPVPTQWESAVLPAGEYSLAFEGVTRPLIVRRQNKVVAVIGTSAIVSEGALGKGNALIGIRNGKTLRIRALTLAQARVTFHYALPKEQGPLMAQAGPKLIERIPITMSGK
jgi:hypothetical protein